MPSIVLELLLSGEVYTNQGGLQVITRWYWGSDVRIGVYTISELSYRVTIG